MTRAEERAQHALHRAIAAGLILDAKLKEYEAACWLGLQSNIEQARAAVQSATDAKLDATQEQIRALKAQHGYSS